jgi:hypothetical protein
MTMANFYHDAAMAVGDFTYEPEGSGVREIRAEVESLGPYEIAGFAAGFVFGNDDTLPDDGNDCDCVFVPMLRGRNAATRVEYLTQLEKLMLFLGALPQLQRTEQA